MRRHATSEHVLPSLAALVVCATAGCKGPERPRVSVAGSQTIAVGRAGLSLRAVAGDGDQTFVALSSGEGTVIEARRGTKLTWSQKLPGNAAALSRVGGLLVVAVSGTTDLQVRGDPGAVLIAVDATTGARKWQLAIDGSEWSLITGIAAIGNDIVVGGSFAGTLRIGSRVVASAGTSDGFVARIRDGQPAWLVRLGGAGIDAVQGVATTSDRVAIAGTFSAGADILGQSFAPFDERLPFADAFVAELDGAGARRWHASFGGRGDETIAGVAIDGRGNVVVAGSVREVVHVGSAQLVTQGASDGLIVWYSPDGDVGPATLVGGHDFDGLRGIAALGDRIVVGGFFSGRLQLDRELAAGGGDDAFFAAYDFSGALAASWHVSGAGREDVAAIATMPGGFIAGVQYSASANVDEDKLAAPGDPLTGAALVVRGL